MSDVCHLFDARTRQNEIDECRLVVIAKLLVGEIPIVWHLGVEEAMGLTVAVAAGVGDP